MLPLHDIDVSNINASHLQPVSQRILKRLRDETDRAEDVQCESVYEWMSPYELVDLTRRFTDKQTSDFVSKVASRAGIPEPILMTNPDQAHGGECWLERDGLFCYMAIVIRPNHRTRSVILHEIAHLVVLWNDVRQPDGRVVASHGPEYMGILMAVMVQFWGNRNWHIDLEECQSQAVSCGVEWDYTAAFEVLPWLRPVQ